jgi:hypothetical protein
VSEPLDPVSQGLLRAESDEIRRLARETTQQQLDLARAGQRRAKALGHVEIARKQLRGLGLEMGRRLRELGMDPAEVMRLSMAWTSAQAELVVAAEELRPEGESAKTTGKVIDLGVRFKR